MSNANALQLAVDARARVGWRMEVDTAHVTSTDLGLCSHLLFPAAASATTRFTWSLGP
jgi:hypothetical protein